MPTLHEYEVAFNEGGSDNVRKLIQRQNATDADTRREVDRLEDAGWNIDRRETSASGGELGNVRFVRPRHTQ